MPGEAVLTRPMKPAAGFHIPKTLWGSLLISAGLFPETSSASTKHRDGNLRASMYHQLCNRMNCFRQKISTGLYLSCRTFPQLYICSGISVKDPEHPPLRHSGVPANIYAFPSNRLPRCFPGRSYCKLTCFRPIDRPRSIRITARSWKPQSLPNEPLNLMECHLSSVSQTWACTAAVELPYGMWRTRQNHETAALLRKLT
jgi:hypothetical protein